MWPHYGTLILFYFPLQTRDVTTVLKKTLYIITGDNLVLEISSDASGSTENTVINVFYNLKPLPIDLSHFSEARPCTWTNDQHKNSAIKSSFTLAELQRVIDRMEQTISATPDT